jgi:hypothetical protein
MCMVPPLWFYLVNPRVDALKELAETGKKNNKNVYDFVTPFTEHDKQIMWVGYGFLVLFQIFLTYYTFF